MDCSFTKTSQGFKSLPYTSLSSECRKQIKNQATNTDINKQKSKLNTKRGNVKTQQ